MAKLSEKYRISDRNLELRKQFLRLDDQDRRILARLTGWADRKADEIAREFYDHQFSFPPTIAYFEGQARRRGVSMPDLRRHLEKSQAGYLRQIFEEAANGGHFGTDYFDKRLHVGKIHNYINLPVKWYLGAYLSYFDLVRKHLKSSFPMRPRFREKAERALFAIFNYDTQAVIDAFFYDYLESIGLDLDRIAVTHADHDLSEYYAEMKDVVRETLTETIDTTQVLEETMTRLVADLGQVQQATGAISAASNHVAGSTQTLAASVEETSSSIAQMAASIQQVAGNSEILSAAVSQTSASIEEMAASVHQVALTVEEANQVAESSASVAQEGRTSVEQTISGMGQINRAMHEVVTVITNLGQSSEEIGNIISVIDDIAEQTNLLALNAAIEAARAGEHGRGFAVVADEVRKLAERSAKATGEIATLIKGIQRETEQAVQSTQQGAKAISEGTGLAQKAGESLQGIVTSVSQVSTLMGQIQHATQEQSRAAAQITAAVTAMNQLTRSVMGATQEQTTGSEQIVRAVETISRITQEVAAATAEQRQAGERAVDAIVRISDLSSEVNRKTSSLARAVSYFKLAKSSKSLAVPAAGSSVSRI
jgi:methyl-accepting chemotaxis protein